MLVLSQDKMTLIEISGKIITVEKSLRDGEYGILARENIRNRDCQVILGEYSSRARAQEVLYSIMLGHNGDGPVFRMPAN